MSNVAAKAMRALSEEDRNRLIAYAGNKVIDGRKIFGWRDTPYTRGEMNVGEAPRN